MISRLKQEVILTFVSWLLLLALAIAGLAVIGQDPAFKLPGDGFEYLMMPVSIMNHGSTDVTDQDIEDAKVYYQNNIFDTIYRDREDITLVRGSDGKDYAKHFGFYSVVCMPLRAAFHMIGQNPAKAFQYMNLVFWVAAALMIQLVLQAKQWQKTLLMIFTVINPAWFYLTWVHTEIMMFSMVIAGLVMLHNKRYVLAMLFISLAAMNNLTLLVPAFFLGIGFIITAFKENDKKIGVVIKKTIPVLVSSIPGFVPIIRSFILFGTYSPVAAVASVSGSGDPTDNRLICGLSYILDPNQGMIAYTLLIVPAFFVVLVINFVKRKNILVSVLSLLTILLMLFIVSQELHINCGMSYIMRYNVWILPFMAFFNVFNMRPVAAFSVLGISGLWTGVILVVMTVFYTPNLYLDHTFMGRFALDSFPSVYNPPVGIFYSRTLTEETYYCDFPVPYFDEQGNLRKILITPEAEKCFEDGEYTIYDPSFEPVNFWDLPYTYVNGSSFRYVNITEDGYHMIRDSHELDFSDLTENDISIIRSSVGYEGDLALVYDNDLHLLFHVLPGSYTGRFSIENVFGGVQDITVKVNGEVVYAGPVTMDDDYLEFDYVVTEDCLCDIVIDIPNALSPMSVIPGSDDNRVLSLYLRDFTYTLND